MNHPAMQWSSTTAWRATPLGRGAGHQRRKPGAVQKRRKAVRNIFLAIDTKSLSGLQLSGNIVALLAIAGQSRSTARLAIPIGKCSGHQTSRSGAAATMAVDALLTMPMTVATALRCMAGQNQKLCGAVSTVV